VPTIEIAQHAANAVATPPNPWSRQLTLASSGNHDVARVVFMDRTGSPPGLGTVTGSEADGWRVQVNLPLDQFADWYAVAQDQQINTFFFMYDESTNLLKSVVIRAGEFPPGFMDSVPEELRSAIAEGVEPP